MECCHRLHYNFVQQVAAPVRVFAGTADAVMPYHHVQDWAQHAVHANVELIPVEGGTHDGLMHTHKAAALQALAQDWAAVGASNASIGAVGAVGAGPLTGGDSAN